MVAGRPRTRWTAWVNWCSMKPANSSSRIVCAHRSETMQRHLVIQVGILLWLKDSALDDTCYFVPCGSKAEADCVQRLYCILNLPRSC